MTDGEALFLFLGFIAGVIASFSVIFLGDYTTYQTLQKKLKKE